MDKEDISCKSCSHTNIVGSKFCNNCGSNLLLQTVSFQKEYTITNDFASDIRLLNDKIRQMDHVMPEVLKQLEHVNEIKEELKRLETLIDKSGWKVHKEKEDLDKLKGFSLSSLKKKLTGNYDQDLDEEQSEYLEALTRYEALEIEVKNMRNMNETAKKDYTELTEIQTVQTRMKNELERYIENISKNFGNEVTLQKRSQISELDLEKTPRDKEIIHYEKVLSKVNIALASYVDALEIIKTAKQASTMDFFSNSMALDFVKRTNISGAQAALTRGDWYLRDALQLMNIQYDTMSELPQSNIVTDILFDDILSNLSSHNKVNQSEEIIRDQYYVASKLRDKIYEEMIPFEKQLKSINTRIKKLNNDILEEQIKMAKNQLDL